MKQKNINKILEGLMQRYTTRVPDVKTIINAMIKNNIIQSANDIINDHIAFRTMGVPQLGIQSLEKIFIHYGYTKEDYFNFKTKKLNAFWYSPPKTPKNLPRIFISECRVNDFSKKSQTIIKKYTDQIPTDPVKTLNLDNPTAIDHFLHTPLWKTPTLEDYEHLKQESEYASWVIYNRYYLNHFTISIHALPSPYNTLEQFNEFLKEQNIKLNTAGGEIKISKDTFLKQSSTVSNEINASFPTKNNQTITTNIAGSYVEFAERLMMPNNTRRDGFETGNADKIFESTFSEQIKKP
ncbi:DUF1338 domain-containing protein [Candidatus Marinamargulisbacteria bacterium SCGC AG-414-C22]|nr:DUF1338 domain-containing protein [Candidatus Marinamargulisbacteria bacterium SCGC AG-414-C22]